MKKSLSIHWVVCLAFAANAQLAPDVLLHPTNPPPPNSVDTEESVRRWNRIAIDASGYDHTPVRVGENRVFGEQLGPGRSARAMAIVHVAMFDAMNALLRRYESYTDLRATAGATSLDAAVSQSAHDTLVALFPSQAGQLDAQLALSLNRIADGITKSKGVQLGKDAATTILELMRTDGSAHPEPKLGVDWFTSDLPGQWRQDPVSRHPMAMGGHWGECRPFVLSSVLPFRVAPFPSLDSPEYAAAFAEVKRLGGDGKGTPTERTPDQTHIGIFWAYDGTPSLCAPPRLYNQIALQIADQRGTAGLELARLLALVNVSMADAAVAIWESKYHYNIWRPVTGIREADSGSGPTGQGDGNPATAGDAEFTPLGAPASNLQGPNFTPPFPSYPSGHAGFGGALFQTLRRFYGTDKLPFSFVSDEFNGETRANDGTVRPLLPRHYATLSQAEEENGQSRIYLGIHWSFDKTAGIDQGRRISDYIFDHAFRPLRIPLMAGDLDGDGVVDEEEVRTVIANHLAGATLRVQELQAAGRGKFQFQLTNSVSPAFEVEASSDLRTWTPLSAPTVSVFEFSDPGALEASHRFYRIHPR